ncbi:MAG: protein phosphatase 2C domain-containing protein [Burkholderiaceae bacterium]
MSSVPQPTSSGSMHYRYAHATHRGMVREQNEDTIGIAEECGLALVADGMGGYNAGEVASELAAEFLMTHLVADLTQLRGVALQGATVAHGSKRMLHAVLRARIDGANEAIIDVARREPECEGMGTTLAMLLFSGDAATTLHLGDSRIYRMRDRVLSLLTRDHSLLQEQIDAGVLTPGEARASINRNFVTRALGVDLVADPEINDYDLVAGDLYLICSDGLPDMLSDEEIFDLLQMEVRSDADDSQPDDEEPVDGHAAEPAALQEVAARLVDAANAQGGRDNVSVVLASVGWVRGAARERQVERLDTEDDPPDGRQQDDRRSA